MKKLIILITILTVTTMLIGCSNYNSKNSEGVMDQIQILNNEDKSHNNFVVLITDNAKNKMINELSKNINLRKTYSIKYYYTGSG